MSIKTLLLAATLAAGSLIPDLAAQELRYQTLEMRGGSMSAEPQLMSVAQRRRVQSRPRYVVKRRTKKKSAAIVGGSAAAGAAIGALAGGGKGAAIGAIAGGGAGFVYDRHTHKKVYRRY